MIIKVKIVLMKYCVGRVDYGVFMDAWIRCGYHTNATINNKEPRSEPNTTE
jgi:hypothetical protein